MTAIIHTPVPGFSITEARAFVEAKLASQPTLPRLRRPEPIGDLVARFVLPLSVCPTTNSTRHGQRWAHAKLKTQCFTLMRLQHAGPPAPLSGRPFIRCIRFSANEPDAYADYAKIAIDRLRVTRQVIRILKGGRRVSTTVRGLGFIVDDSPRHVLVSQTWEPGPRSSGCVVLDIYTGETE